jgi:hypothetical protein
VHSRISLQGPFVHPQGDEASQVQTQHLDVMELSQLVVWNMAGLFFHILGMIIPTDFHIFQRGGSTTNQFLFCHGGTPYFHPVVDGLLKQPW